MFLYILYAYTLFFLSFCVCLLICVQGGSLGRYVQRKLSGLKIFEEPFGSMRENLRVGVAICEQWVLACEHLTAQVHYRGWRNVFQKMVPKFKTFFS